MVIVSQDTQFYSTGSRMDRVSGRPKRSRHAARALAMSEQHVSSLNAPVRITDFEKPFAPCRGGAGNEGGV